MRRIRSGLVRSGVVPVPPATVLFPAAATFCNVFSTATLSLSPPPPPTHWAASSTPTLTCAGNARPLLSFPPRLSRFRVFAATGSINLRVYLLISRWSGRLAFGLGRSTKRWSWHTHKGKETQPSWLPGSGQIGLLHASPQGSACRAMARTSRLHLGATLGIHPMPDSIQAACALSFHSAGDNGPPPTANTSVNAARSCHAALSSSCLAQRLRPIPLLPFHRSDHFTKMGRPNITSLRASCLVSSHSRYSLKESRMRPLICLY